MAGRHETATNEIYHDDVVVVIRYDGKPVYAVLIMEWRDGIVARETAFFGDPIEPPAWRSPWVEITGTAERRERE